MKMKSKFLLCILLTIGMVLLHVGLYFGDNQYTASDIQPVNGLIRLTKSDLKKNSLIFLCRDWQVYPDALLSPEDFSSGEADTLYSRYIAPGEYGGMDLGDPSAYPRGSMTYRLNLSLPEESNIYSLLLPTIYSSYRLYINDELVLTCGNPDPDQYEESVQQQVVSFEASGMTRILVAVTDRTAFYSGMNSPPVLGTPNAVNNLVEMRNLIRSIFLLLNLFLIVVYLYLYIRSRQKIYLIILLACLCIGIYLAYPLVRSFFSAGIYLNYAISLLQNTALCSTYLLIICIFCVYFSWEHNLCRIMQLISGGVLGLVWLMTAIVPLIHYTPVLYLLSLISNCLQLALIVCFSILFLLTLRENGEYSLLLLAGCDMILFCLVSDFIRPLFKPIYFGDIMEVAFILFIFVICILQLRDTSSAYYFRLTYQYRMEQAQRLLAMERVHYSQLRKKIDDTRRTRHDLRQHLRVLDTFLAQGDTEQARRYLQEYTHSNETALHQALQFCPNLTADSVLSYYHGLIVQEKAGFAFHGTIPELEEIQDVDLSAMLGNLLENALEAVRSQKQGERFVHLHADMVSNKLVLHMENSFSGQIHQKGQQFYSSKHSGMGIGTESISMIARKYGGFADFSVENGVFHSRIFIPIPSAKTPESMKKASHS